jgi:hypothetical protein
LIFEQFKFEIFWGKKQAWSNNLQSTPTQKSKRKNRDKCFSYLWAWEIQPGIHPQVKLHPSAEKLSPPSRIGKKGGPREYTSTFTWSVHEDI